MSENISPTRKRPKSAVTRELFLYSGNQCSFTGCTKPLLNKKGSYVAEIAHIEGVGVKSARHNPKLSDDDLRKVSNLMLMCPNHHTEIDDKQRLSEFTVEALREMKEKHEGKFRDAIMQMSADIGDLTDLEPIYPTSLHAFGFLPEDEFHDEEMAAVRDFIDTLAKLPPAARQILVVAVGQSNPSGIRGLSNRLEAPAIAVERSVTRVGEGDYGQLLRLLRQRGLLDWDDDFEGTVMLDLNGKSKINDSELDVLLELRSVFGDDKDALRRAIVELDFSIIDTAPARTLD